MAIFSNNTSVGTFIRNGDFNLPVLSSGGFLVNSIAIKYWSALNGTAQGTGGGTSYAVAKGGTDLSGNANAFYRGSLPSNFTQFFVATSAAGSTQSVTLTQSIKFDTSGTFLVQFYAFPGAAVDPAHALTVYFNKAVVQTSMLLGSVANGGYQSFNLPISVPVPGITYTLGFAFQCATAPVAASSLCLSHVRIVPEPNPTSLLDAVDPSGIVLYYPLDASSNLDNYSTGVAVPQSTAYGTGAALAVTPSTAFLGTGYLSLTGALSQYLTLSQTLTVTPAGGFTLCGWFNLSGVTGTSVSSLVTVSTSAAGATGSIGIYINSVLGTTGISNYLTTIVRDAAPIIHGNAVTFAQNDWYFFAMIVRGGGAYQCYLNNAVVASGSYTAPFATATTYTAASVGYDPNQLLGTGIFKYAYFNGSLTDLRMYTRALGVNELTALWTAGWSALHFPQYNLIDTTGLSMYYGFDASVLYGSTLAYMGLLNNGSFALPAVTSAGGSVNAAMDFWTVSLSGVGDSYRVYRYPGTGTGAYSYGLPAIVGDALQYLAVTSVARSTTTFTQTLSIQLPGAYVLSLVLFPTDAQYSAAQTVSVQLGTMPLLSNVSLTVSSSTVPYTVYNLNVGLPAAASYPLTVTVLGGTALGTSTSTLGLTGMVLRQYASVLGSGYTAVDPSGLVLYYPSDVSTNATTTAALNNYATGVGVTDASMVSGVAIAASNSWVGSGYLQLDGSSGYLNTVTPFTVGSTLGSGFTVSFWYNATTPLATGTNTFFMFQSASGDNVTAYYANTAFSSEMLIVRVTPRSPGVASTLRVDSNQWESSIWNHIVLVGQCTSATGGVGGRGTGSYTIYLNDASLGTFSGDWCPSTFTRNTMGAAGGAGGFLNGNVDDFRVYTRALSRADLDTLWDYGTRNNGAGGGALSGLIDPSGMVQYYPFDQGTLSNATYVASASLLRPSMFYGIIDVSAMSLYYPFEY